MRIAHGCYSGLLFIGNRLFSPRSGKVNDRIPTLIVLTTMIIIGGIKQVEGCNQIASIQASEDVCVQSDNKEPCSLNKVSILNVRPNGSIACFRVRDEHRQLEMFLEIQAEAIVSKCIQRTHHFSRDFDVEHSWSHRCWKAGNCYDEVCESVSANTTELNEISTESKRAPGYSKCYRTCGCITCGWCLHCVPSCLFSRIFAIPKSTNIYEIITCPAWSTVLDVRINFNGNHSNHRIDHGIPFELPGGNITIVITGFSTPPTPAHTATFIKQWSTEGKPERFGFTYTSVSQPGAPSRGLIGEFQCPSHADAVDFHCVFDERLCDCTPKGTSIKCNCYHIKLDNLINSTSLPRDEAGINLLVEDGQIITKLTSNSMVAIQVQFQNQSIQRIVRDDDCTLTHAKISGCFSCGKGAQLHGVCQSKENDRIEATVQCPTIGTDFLECTKEGREGYFDFNSNNPSIDEDCKISCGKKSNSFNVKGTLDELSTFDLRQLREHFAVYSELFTESNVWSTVKDTIFGAVTGVGDAITRWIGSWVIIGLMIVGIVFLAQLYFAVNCPFFGFLGRRRECRDSPAENPIYQRRKKKVERKGSKTQ
ncbi:unnamed protein product [Caenorhabditis sp. 36 PRJEB53466]|nr:unnamed protein product [Caenorhabditis sp. 36 PRJEB53466]